MWTRRSLLFALGFVVVGMPACQKSLGEERNPVKIMIVPSRDQKATAEAAKAFAKHLTEQTGLHFSVEVPIRYIDLVVAVGDRRADLLFMNDMSYLLAHDEFGAQAVLATRRGDREDRYRGVILTHRDSGLTELSQLAGKKIAYVDVHSVSGYIMPAMMLKKAGISPENAIKTGSHEKVVELVYRREADAGFSYSDTPADVPGKPRDVRGRLEGKFPDIFEKVIIIGSTGQIPNEPIVFGEHVPESVRTPIVQAMQSYVATPEGRKAFMDLNEITGLRPVTDANYDTVRHAVKGLGKKLDEMVPGGGILELKRKERIEPVPPLGN